MKKALSLILAAAMATGMTVASFAAPVGTGYKIDKVVDDKALTFSADLDDVTPDNRTVTIALPSNMFKWVDAKTGADATTDAVAAGDGVTEAQLRAGKITVKTTVSKGSNVIDKVEFDTNSDKEAVIKVKFVENFVSTKEVDYDFSVYLLDNKTRVEGTKVNLAGTYKNRKINVDADDNDVYTGDKTVVEADEYIKEIKVDLGNEVYATTKMFKDKKYYGVATNEPKAEDDAMMSKYPEIEVVYTIDHVGLAGSVITFDIGDKMYAYDKDGKYLGTTADKLAFSEKYYLTSKKIDINTAEEVEEDEDVTEAPVDETPDNTNNNPETGVNGMVNVAVVAGVVALAAAGAVALKK